MNPSRMSRMPICKKCKQPKKLGRFREGRNPTYRCSTCYKTRTAPIRRAASRRAYKAWSDSLPDERKKEIRRRNQHSFICRTYGVTSEWYQTKLTLQDGKCAICGKKETARTKFGDIRRLSIDHCHKSGRVRDLLCTNCNTTLGQAKDSVQMLDNLIKYLIKWGPAT